MTTNGSSNGARPNVEHDEPAELRAQVAYWRANYRILLRILAEQHDDPALAWLDEIVHTRFSKLL